MKSQRYLIREYTARLRNSKGTFEDIFAAQFSQKRNVFFEFEKDGKKEAATFGEVERQIDSLASYLLSFLKGKKDTYIALNLDNSVEWAVGFYAILKSGNKPYLVNLRHPLSLTLSILATLKVEYCLDFKEGNKYGLPSIRMDDHLHDEAGEVVFPWANEIALSTSATTMQEKIVLYTGAEILEQLRNTESVLKKTRAVRKTYGGTIKLLAFLPFYHIFGLIATFFWFTYFGYEIVLLGDYAPQTILRTIRRFGVTHLFAVPLFYHEIEKSVLSEVEKRGMKKKFEKGCDLSLKLPSWLSLLFARRAFREIRQALFGDSVRFCIVGGSYVRPSALRLLNAIGYPLYNGYGTSEIGITSCDFSTSIKTRIKGSVGRPFPSASYRIEDGCLCVEGKSTCYATIVGGTYIKQEGAFNTLDLVEKDADGLYYVKGRKSDLIVSKNGENLNPDDLEASFHLDSFPLKRFVILGLGEHKDEPSFVGEVLESITKEEAEALRGSLFAQNEALPMSSRLTAFYLTRDPLQSEGAIKVSRSYVYAKLEKGDIRLLSFDDLFKKEEVAAGEIEQIVTEIFAKNLSIDKDKIAPSSHFVYDLGGTSLSYYSIMVEINERFHIELTYDEDKPLFTVDEFASAIKEALGK